MSHSSGGPSDRSSVMAAAPSPAQKALIVICEKCGRKIAEAAGSAQPTPSNPSSDLQKNLKASIKERFGKGVARAVTTSCLDICPQGRIAIGVARPSGTEYFTVSAEGLAAVQAEILNSID